MDHSKYASTFGFASLLAGSLIVALDAVALSPSLPTIEDALDATTVETYWAAVAYTLGAATFLPLFPAASDITGRRPICIALLLLFLVGTIVCGTASSIGALLAGRVLQGVGGGGIIGMLYVVMADLFDIRKRAKALSINGLVWLVGTAVGPIMGGGFSLNVSWRWIFWIALPINGIALVLVAVFLRIPHRGIPFSDRRSSGLYWRDLDLLGAFLMVGGLSSFLIAITWAGTIYAWDSSHTLVPLIIGLVCLLVFLAFEARVAKSPILPISVFNNRNVFISFIHTFGLGMIQFGLIFYLPLYYQIVEGYSPLISGVALLPETLLAGPFTMVTGILISKTGKYKLIILFGWMSMSLGCGLLVLLDQKTAVPAWVFLNVPAGIGIGVCFPATTISAQASGAAEHMAIASGLVAFFRSLGQALGVAASNAVILNKVRTRLEDSSLAVLRSNASIIARNVASPKVLDPFLTGDEATKSALVDAYVDGLHAVWWLLFAVAAVCLELTMFMRDMSLNTATRDEASEKRESATANSEKTSAEEEPGGVAMSEAQQASV